MNDKVNQRMCIVCRNMYDKNKLLRIAKIKDDVIIDRNYKSGGRGLYICSNECLDRVLNNKKINRSLKFFINDELLNEAEEILNGKR